jgi:cytochrome c-type biogenesis protein CcmE
MKTKYILGIAIIIIFIIYAGFSFRRSLTPYVDFQQAEKSGSTVQIIGNILHQETSYDIQTGKLGFIIEDKNKNRMKVFYSGVKPANFEQANTAVVIGRYIDGAFQAEKVLVKCPSKYQGKSI